MDDPSVGKPSIGSSGADNAVPRLNIVSQGEIVEGFSTAQVIAGLSGQFSLSPERARILRMPYPRISMFARLLRLALAIESRRFDRLLRRSGRILLWLRLARSSSLSSTGLPLFFLPVIAAAGIVVNLVRIWRTC